MDGISYSAIECIGTEIHEGGTCRILSIGEGMDDSLAEVFASTNSRGPGKSPPDEVDCCPVGRSCENSFKNFSKREHPSFIAVSESTDEGKVVAIASKSIDKRHGAIHCEDKFIAAVVTV